MSANRMTAAAVGVAFVAVLAAGAVERYSRNAAGDAIETQPMRRAVATEAVDAHIARTEAAVDAPTGTKGARRQGSRPLVNVSAANAATYAVASDEAARLRPIRQAPTIARVSDAACAVVAPGAVRYVQGGGIVRAITNTFPCPTTGVARARWGAGTRTLTVEYADGTTASTTEVWP